MSFNSQNFVMQWSRDWLFQWFDCNNWSSVNFSLVDGRDGGPDAAEQRFTGPRGASWGLRNAYGFPPHVRHEIWTAIVGAMLEHAGLGRDWSPSKWLFAGIIPWMIQRAEMGMRFERWAFVATEVTASRQGL